jgi:glycerol-3-phosphate dehydrogenase
MGRCQGGFCSPRVAAILAGELGVELTEITKDGGASRLLVSDIETALKTAATDKETTENGGGA